MCTTTDNDLLNDHHEIRNNPFHPDYEKPTALENVRDGLREIRMMLEDKVLEDLKYEKKTIEKKLLDPIDFKCPCKTQIVEIVESIDNIQDHIDLDVVNAKICVNEEKRRYEILAKYPDNRQREVKQFFEIWSDYLVILTGSLDAQDILMQRISQRILDTDFTIALGNFDFLTCASIIVNSILEGTLLKITLEGTKELIKFIAKVIQLMCDKIGYHVGVDLGNFQISNPNMIPKILGASFALLMSLGCMVRSDDLVHHYGIIFTAIVSLYFSWFISIPINALTGKVIEIWTDLKNEDMSVLSKSMKVGRTLFKEIPIVSSFGNWIFPNLPPPTLQYPFIDRVNDVFKCPLTQNAITYPVSLHGYIFEYYAIKKWLEKENKHPLTRAYASSNQIAKPPTEYTEAYDSYIRRLVAQNS